MAEAASRRVAEACEQLMLGTWSASAYAFAGASLYGLTNFPSRLTKTITQPTVTAWTQKTTVTEVLAMRQQAINFIRAVKGEIKPLCEAAEALEDLRVARQFLKLYKGV